MHSIDGLIDNFVFIRALVLRDLALRQGKSHGVAFLLEFLMPAVIISVHYAIFVVLRRKMPGNMPIEVFLLGGFGCWFAFRNMGGKPIFPNSAVQRITSYPGIKVYHYLLSRLIWEITASLIIIYVGLAFCSLVLKPLHFPAPSSAFIPLFIAALLGIGFQMFFDGLAFFFSLMKHVKRVMIWMVFLTSGIYFVGERHSKDFIKSFTWYSPLSHTLGAMRNLIYPISGQSIDQISLFYALSWALGLIAVGSISFAAAGKLRQS